MADSANNRWLFWKYTIKHHNCYIDFYINDVFYAASIFLRSDFMFLFLFIALYRFNFYVRSNIVKSATGVIKPLKAVKCSLLIKEMVKILLNNS